MALDMPPPRGTKVKGKQATAAKGSQKDKMAGKGYSPWAGGRVYPADPGLTSKIGPGTSPLDSGLRGSVGGTGTSAALGGSTGGDAGGTLGTAGGDLGVLDPLANPEYLAALADIDASEAQAVGTVRAKQDAARRALDDLLGEIADREGKSNVRTRESQEGRGLLRSGATERLLADVAEAAGGERSRGESVTSDQIGDLERAIAEARIAAQRARSDAQLRFAGVA